MFLKIEILLIPLLANSHIFEISEEVRPQLLMTFRLQDFQKKKIFKIFKKKVFKKFIKAKKNLKIRFSKKFKKLN
jgi:hypothetical protein